VRNHDDTVEGTGHGPTIVAPSTGLGARP
jgi:hypothetical protein